MKLQVLIASMALAVASGAFAQASPGNSATSATPAMPASPPTSAGMAATPATPATPAMSSAEKKGKTTHAKAKSKKKLSAKKARSNTRSMGAGPAMPATDLQARDRQARMDQAYANWQSGARR